MITSNLVSTVNIVDSVVSLDTASPYYIGHKGMVLHGFEDDGNPYRSPSSTGSAGPRVGCCLITHSKHRNNRAVNWNMQQPQISNQTQQVSNQVSQISNQSRQISNQYPQTSNQYPQETNQTSQISNQHPQESNQSPQVSNQQPQISLQEVNLTLIYFRLV